MVALMAVLMAEPVKAKAAAGTPGAGEHHAGRRA
jgi:hypothetical protein